MLLKQLTAQRGVSGNEAQIRNFILEQVKPYADEIKVDAMGCVIAWKKSKNPDAKTVMLSAHMDEVGFMVEHIREDGFIGYSPIGGIDPAVCIAKRVKIGDDEVAGVIGCKAVHMQTPDESKNPLSHTQLFIDIGAKDKADALAHVKVGDYVTFDSNFVLFGNNKVKSRALDDRIGCLNLIELLKGDYPCHLACAFTVQEEVGCKGALSTAFRVKPDVAVVLEGTTANNTADSQIHTEVSCVGEGVAISFMDRASIATPALFSAMVKLAQDKGIKYQIKKGVAGGNDAGNIQRTLGGCSTVVLSVPCRYIHSPSSVADLGDIENQFELAKAFLQEGGKF